MNQSEIVIWVVAGLTWLIVMLVLVQLSRFLAKFQEGRRDLDANIIGMTGQLKKLQSTVTEILVEQKRVTRLTLEGLDLKKAEMTGDFEIIEEPIPGAGAAPEPPPPPALEIPKAKSAGPVFPELMK